MENKKTKLTISGSPKKSLKQLNPQVSQGKKTVVIEKSSNKFSKKTSFKKSFGNKQSFDSKRGPSFNLNTQFKTPPITSDFERRKLAEQRATKRLKGDQENKDKKTKLGTKKEKLN